ncbi:MAG: Acyl-CoA dehydrogenase, partial [Bacilli bacterium]|nr:Acyl-CoA dehydrogenase [Bacilli bacterium]
MSKLDPFIRNEEDQKLVDFAGCLADEFAGRAADYDRTGEFSHENVDRLRAAGYMKLTVPKEYGGDGISLYQLCLVQERLAQGDSSTALAVGWSVGKLLNLRSTRAWPEELFAKICKSVVEHGATINSCASEPATGSPSRGGRPQTTAVKQADGSWLLNGRKTWSTLSPALDWFLVTAAVEDREGSAEFLIPRGTNGLQIDYTWNSMGMRATGSHDLVLTDVRLPADSLIQPPAPAEQQKRRADAGAWMLHIPACYLGVAASARRFALEYALSYRPNSLPGPIAEVPHIQDKIGHLELDLFTARSLLYSVAERWDTYFQSGTP